MSIKRSLYEQNNNSNNDKRITFVYKLRQPNVGCLFSYSLNSITLFMGSILSYFITLNHKEEDKEAILMGTSYRKWKEFPYPGEKNPPKGSPEAGYWPMFFILRGRNDDFLDPFHQRINWRIKNPNDIDWEKELIIVEQTLKSLTPEQIRIAQYWGTGELTAKINTMIFGLAEKYMLGSPNVARVLGYFNAAINDVFVITWFFKYLWDVARPNQYDRNLHTVLFTPRFPSYPSAHATIAGCAEVLLSYFFPPESSNIKKLMEESAQSRLYASVHFKVDNDEGLRLGRHIGELVVKLLKVQNLNTLQ